MGILGLVTSKTTNQASAAEAPTYLIAQAGALLGKITARSAVAAYMASLARFPLVGEPGQVTRTATNETNALDTASRVEVVL